MAEAIKYGFYTVNPDYLEYLNQIDSEEMCIRDSTISEVKLSIN